MCVNMCVYTYIYIYRERERERCIHMHTHIHLFEGGQKRPFRRAAVPARC